LASKPSAKPGSVSPKRLDEPPDAGPHVRWCERGRGDPAPYSIQTKESPHQLASDMAPDRHQTGTRQAPDMSSDSMSSDRKRAVANQSGEA
jgi:hypothetical protein